MGALVSVNASISNTRFTDAINSTVSNLQKQYAEVQSGRNSRDATLGCAAGTINNSAKDAGMTNCVVLGRLIQFDVGGSAISSRYIIGRDSASLSGSDTDVIQAAIPVSVSGNGLESTFDVPWSMEIDAMKRGSIDVNYLAIIRSPVSERILFYSFNGPDNLTTLTSSHISETNLNKAVDICLLDGSGFGGSRVGYVRIGAGQGQDIIKADLTNTSGACS